MTRPTWEETRNRRLAAPEAQQAYWQAHRAYLLGGEVRRLREQEGISQRQLADRMGSTQSVVARLEAGGVEPSLKTLERAAAALGVTLDIAFRPGR